MPKPQNEPLRTLTAEEQTALERLTQASSARVDHVRRARALLAVAQGRPFVQAGRQAGFHSGSAIAGLVQRFNRQGMAALRITGGSAAGTTERRTGFNRQGMAALRITPGRGRRPTYAPAARAQIVATAQRSPDRKTDGTATWSLSTLQRTLRREAFPSLGATTIRRVLQDAGRSYQRTRTWCPTGTAQRKRKAGVVTVVDPRTEEKRA